MHKLFLQNEIQINLHLIPNNTHKTRKTIKLLIAKKLFQYLHVRANALDPLSVSIQDK